MQSAYQLQYVDFLKLREKYKQQVQELNSLRTEKTSILIKINDLEERLPETQLQLERVLDKKLIHMLSIHKCPTNKNGLGYVSPSTSQTIFVKLVIPESPPSSVDKGKTIMVGEVPVIPESPPSSVDKGKTIMVGEVPVIPQPRAKLPIRRKPPTCYHCCELGHIRPKCPHQQV